MNVLHAIVPTSGVSQLATSIAHSSTSPVDDDELALSSDELPLSLPVLLSLALDDDVLVSSLPVDELDALDELELLASDELDALDELDDDVALASVDDPPSPAHPPATVTTATVQPQPRIDHPTRHQ